MREPGRVRSPLRGTDTDGFPSQRATTLVVVTWAWAWRFWWIELFCAFFVCSLHLIESGTLKLYFNQIAKYISKLRCTLRFCHIDFVQHVWKWCKAILWSKGCFSYSTQLQKKIHLVFPCTSPCIYKKYQEVSSRYPWFTTPSYEEKAPNHL